MSRSALSGLRVIDFTHMIAGPYGAQLLAYFGAQVIKVESVKHPDGFRRSGYGVSGAGINASRAFAEFNRNKLNVTVNMATEEGRDVVRRLVAVSDVVMENFSRSVMERWGMEYAGLRRVRPDLVMVSLQGMGQRGPKRDWVTWGPSLMPYAGLTTMWGYPDQPEPVGSQIAFPDYVVSTQMAFVVLAALEHRRRTGEGQFVEFAQVAGTVSLLPTTNLDYSVNGRVLPPRGNGHPEHAPHGVYPCLGEDRWCAIAVTSEEQWQRFCGCIGRPQLVDDERFTDGAARVRHAGALDAVVSEWTRDQPPHAVMQRLQAAGVPAGAVQNARDLNEDPHLQARGMLTQSDHPEVRNVVFPGIPVRLSETPGAITRHAPMLGMDNAYVLRELLGMEPAEIARLTEQEVLV